MDNGGENLIGENPPLGWGKVLNPRDVEGADERRYVGRDMNGRLFFLRPVAKLVPAHFKQF